MFKLGFQCLIDVGMLFKQSSISDFYEADDWKKETITCTIPLIKLKHIKHNKHEAVLLKIPRLTKWAFHKSVYQHNWQIPEKNKKKHNITILGYTKWYIDI